MLGSAGSNRIRSALLQTIVGVVDHGLDAARGGAAPRVHFEGGVVYAEPGIDARRARARRARRSCASARLNLFFGGVQAVRAPRRRADRRRRPAPRRRGGAAREARHARVSGAAPRAALGCWRRRGAGRLWRRQARRPVPRAAQRKRRRAREADAARQRRRRRAAATARCGGHKLKRATRSSWKRARSRKTCRRAGLRTPRSRRRPARCSATTCATKTAPSSFSDNSAGQPQVFHRLRCSSCGPRSSAATCRNSADAPAPAPSSPQPKRTLPLDCARDLRALDQLQALDRGASSIAEQPQARVLGAQLEQLLLGVQVELDRRRPSGRRPVGASSSGAELAVGRLLDQLARTARARCAPASSSGSSCCSSRNSTTPAG